MFISKNGAGYLRSHEFLDWVDTFRAYLGINTTSGPFPKSVWSQVGKISGIGFYGGEANNSVKFEKEQGDNTMLAIFEKYPRSSVLWSGILLILCKLSKAGLNEKINCEINPDVKDCFDTCQGCISRVNVEKLFPQWIENFEVLSLDKKNEVDQIPFLSDAIDFLSLVFFNSLSGAFNDSSLVESKKDDIIWLLGKAEEVYDGMAKYDSIKEGRVSIDEAISFFENKPEEGETEGVTTKNFITPYVEIEKRAIEIAKSGFGKYGISGNIARVASYIHQGASSDTADMHIERGVKNFKGKQYCKTFSVAIPREVNALIKTENEINRCDDPITLEGWIDDCKESIRNFNDILKKMEKFEATGVDNAIGFTFDYNKYTEIVNNAILRLDHYYNVLVVQSLNKKKEKVSEIYGKLSNYIRDAKNFIKTFTKDDGSIKFELLKDTEINSCILSAQEYIDKLKAECSKESYESDLKADSVGMDIWRNLMSTIDEAKRTIGDLEKHKELLEIEGKRRGAIDPEDELDTENSFNIMFDDRNIECVLLPEEINELAISEGENMLMYDYSAYRELVDAAVNVKRQSMFGDYKGTVEYEFFKPFDYQMDSVKTMLSRFEGRGVFGEAVGLGKTIEALLTAQIMHNCKAIRNAVAIVKNREQWKKEAESKFSIISKEDGKVKIKPLFNIPGKVSFKKLLDILKEEFENDQQKESESLKLYLVSLDQITAGESAEYLKKIREIADYKINAERILDDINIKNQACLLDYVRDEYIDSVSSKTATNQELNNYSILKRVISYLIAECVENVKRINKGILPGYKYKVALLWKKDIYESIYQNQFKDIWREFNVSSTEKAKGIILLDELEIKGVDKNRNDLADAIGFDWHNKFERILIYDSNRDISNKRIYSERFDVNAKGNDNESVYDIVAKYNKKIKAVIKHIDEIKGKIIGQESDNLYNKSRFIDLLIFDEVQEDKAVNESNKASEKEELAHDFIANIQKKYLILLSATPIREDLKDIFNLLYMVDRERLGMDKEKAKDRFFKTYCGSKKSLSEIAEKWESNSFKVLNGLINSMFTRQRLYDDRVIKSMMRKTATEEDIEKIKHFKHRLDNSLKNITGERYKDYGGAKFLRLVELEKFYLSGYKNEIRAILDNAEYAIKPTQDNETEKVICEKLTELKQDFYGADASNVENKEFLTAIDGISRCIDVYSDVVNCKISEEKRGGASLNVCQAFSDNYEQLVTSEEDLPNAKGNPNLEKELIQRIKESVDNCDRFCGYINRSLLDYYRYSTYYHDESNAKKRMSMTFLLPYIDWTRPRKTGKALLLETGAEKEKFITEILSKDGNCDEFVQKGIIDQSEVEDIRNGKVVVFESNVGRRKNAYDKAERSGRCVFKAKNKEQKQKAIENFKKTNKYNWNAIFFIDQNQIVGEDLNAANILILNQFDKGDGKYLEPLEIEQAIGRISRVGQTDECKIYITLYCGKDDVRSAKNLELSRAYYDILADEKGFDLFGLCQTELSFLVPVVNAFLKRMFSIEHIYDSVNDEKFKNDSADFKAYRISDSTKVAEMKKDAEFTDILKYALDNEDKIKVYHVDNDKKESHLTPKEAIKKLIQNYADVLRPKDDGSSS